MSTSTRRRAGHEHRVNPHIHLYFEKKGRREEGRDAGRPKPERCQNKSSVSGTAAPAAPAGCHSGQRNMENIYIYIKGSLTAKFPFHLCMIERRQVWSGSPAGAHSTRWNPVAKLNRGVGFFVFKLSMVEGNIHLDSVNAS